MAKRRILVVEDDLAVRQGVVDALDFDGYEVHEAGTFKDAVRMGVQMDHDLILLDLVLPGGDGLDVLSEVRAARDLVPIIILTARGMEDDRVEGLKRGADDYIVKPFSIKELLARVEAVLRRSAERPSALRSFECATGTVNLEQSQLELKGGQNLPLSEKEVSLLRYFGQNRGRIISREELLTKVWHLPSGVRTRTVDMLIARLREKIGDVSTPPQMIITVRGRGYRFEPEGGA